MFFYKKIVLILFLLLFVFDIYDCLIPGLKVSLWLRPLQMQVLFLYVFQSRLAVFQNILLFYTLLLTSITEYVFYSSGLTHENLLMELLIIKNLCICFILLGNIKGKIQFSKKLFRWTFNYLLISIGLCFILMGNENWLAYIVAILSGKILLLISMQEKKYSFFRQMYFGYALVIAAMVFGKILVTDSRWFIELITRFALIFGHLLFVSGLAKIKLLPINQNLFRYQTVIQE